MDASTAQLFKALESNQTQNVDDAKDRFRNHFNSSKEPWLVNGLVDYFLVSNSIRAVDVLVIVREPHDKFLFDRIAEILRSKTTRLGALTLLGHIVQRQTTWLYKIVHHPTLMKDLLRILKTDMDMVEVISALLVLNILLPIIPGLIGSHLTDIFEVFSRLAAWNSDSPRQLTSSHVLHLQVALYALFYQLYGMFPCTFIEYLKQEYNVKCDSTNACNVFQHTIKPMIETLRLHPFLILSSTEEELCKERWKKSEHHAVVFNCTRFLLDGTSESALRPLSLSNLDVTASLESSTRLPGGVIDTTVPDLNSPNPSSSLHSSYLLNGMDSPRFSLCCHLSGNTTPAPPHPPHSDTTPTSIPNTPLYKLYPSSLSFPQQEGSSPPEAAIEATPETTPVKDIRPRGRSHTTSSASTAVCALTDFTSPSNENRKHGGSSDIPSSPSLVRTRGDLFNFPSLSSSGGGGGGERKPLALARLIDERLMAQEAALQVGSTTSSIDQRKPPSAPTSPLTLVPPSSAQDGLSLDENNSEPLHNSSETHSHSKLLSGEGVDGFPEDPCSGDQGGEGSEGASCSTGGLHMPNMMWLRRHRPRYLTECTLPTSQSLGLSSPRDVFPLGEPETRVRRAMSCPEMKKSGGGSMTGSVGSAGPPLPEEQDEGVDHPPVGSRLRLVACSTEDATTQTDDHPPTQHSYEHLFLGLFPSTFSYHHVHHHHHHFDMTSPHQQYASSQLSGDDSSPYLTGHSLEPCCVKGTGRGDTFNNTSLESSMLVTRTPGNSLSVESELRFYKEQVALMNLQLHFERHRRQVHLERNRRLLGKSRNNRASEEHNSALRDQVSLLQKDIERSSEGMRELSADQRPQVETLETNVAKLKQENAQLHRDIGKMKTKCETLEQETKNEHEKRSILNEILHETKAKLFDSNNEMEHYKAAIAENKRLNNDLSYLQKEIIILGEMNSKYKDILSYLAQMKNEYSYSTLFNEAYVHQIEQLHKLSDTQARHLESARNQNIKLEQMLADKEKTIGGFKHLFTTVKTKYQDDLEAMTSRYRSVEASLIRQRTEQLELYYELDLNKKRVAKLSKHPGPGPATPLAAQGPSVPSSSHSNPTHLLSLSSFVVSEPTTNSISSNPTDGQNSDLLED